MRNPLTLSFCAVLLLLGPLAGCEETGKFRVTWSFADGEITQASDCSSRGVDRVVITLENPDTGDIKKTTVRPCRDADSGEIEVATGTYRVRVQAFGGSTQPFVDPTTGEEALVELVEDLRVDASGVADAAVVFTRNPQCADGVDNDSDGLVDAADPDCRNKNGDYTPTWNAETDSGEKATLAVTWSLPGATTCDAIQPDGAVQVALLVDELPLLYPPCGDLAGDIPLSAGDYTVALQLLDASDMVLATTPAQDASLGGGLTTTLDFAFSLDTFDPPQTGELSFHVSWIAPGQTCADASPMVAQQSLWLRDADGVTVDAMTLAGSTVDNTAAAMSTCIDASELQGLTAYVPAGDYTLDIRGFTAGGAQCWDATSLDVTVPIGPAPAPLDLVVPQTDATGLCAP